MSDSPLVAYLLEEYYPEQCEYLGRARVIEGRMLNPDAYDSRQALREYRRVMAALGRPVGARFPGERVGEEVGFGATPSRWQEDLAGGIGVSREIWERWGLPRPTVPLQESPLVEEYCQQIVTYFEARIRAEREAQSAAERKPRRRRRRRARA